MCCCGQPTINGQPGYRWQPNDTPSVRPISAPATDQNILYDEPGRCGGQDSHCHHYRVVGGASGAQFTTLLVRHGGGDEAIRLSNGKAVLQALGMLDSNARYWLLNALYHAQADARRAGRDSATHYWRTAAAEKRIMFRKVRGTDRVRVEVAEEEGVRG